MDKLKGALLNVTGKFQENIYMKAISTAMMGLMPIMMISSVASLIGAINIGPSAAFMETTGIRSLLTQVNAMTIDIVSVYVAFLIGYKLSELLESDAVNGGIIGLLSFLILTPLTVTEEFKGLSTENLGSTGMFVAMIGGLVGARLYALFVEKNFVIKMPDSVPPVVNKSFAAIVPGVLVSTLMAIVYVILSQTPFGSLSALVYKIVQTPMTALGANIVACMLIVSFIELLWFFGMHGVLAVYPILMLVFYEPGVANLAAYGAGEALPYLFTMGFILNNRGARSFAVAILCIFRSKSERMKAVGKVGLIPSMFGISEPIKFGIPQVMNVSMLIPLLLTPAVSVLIAYLLTIVGFLPYHNGVQIPTGFPIIIQGFLFNGWQGIISQLLQLLACILIYIPFIAVQDKVYLTEEEQN